MGEANKYKKILDKIIINGIKENSSSVLDLIKEKEELQQRIDKAIRLIEEYHYFVFTKDIETIYKNANKEFINILRGK